MKDPRTTKKRKASELQDFDEDGDTTMRYDSDYSVPESPTAAGENEPESPTIRAYDGHSNLTSPTSTRKSRRQSSRQGQTTVEGEDEERKGEANGTETPSRTGLRSSTRQRKTPKRYYDEIDERPQSAKRQASTPTERTRSTRSARRTRDVSEVDETEWESPQPQTRTLKRTRPRRAAARSNQRDQSVNEDASGKEVKKSPSPDGDQDGFDELVSMQLQPVQFQQDDLDMKDSSGMTPEPLPGYAEEFQGLLQKGLHEELRVLTKFTLEKLNGKRPVPLKGVDSEYQKVHQLIEQTVSSGEGNSMLVFGSRGCGKTTIVESAISSLEKGHGNDFHVVRLNGFLHTDDRLALREMWRQLGRETNTEDEADKVSSYADTMATLLALLSHPEELFGPSDSREAVTAAKSVIIVLDEFDLFVSHARQTLLYNLFDIAQARKAPVAVIGLTTKVDITEMLEKRVKSRFSHRYVYVSLPKSLDTFSDICYTGLNVDESEISELSAVAGGDKESFVISQNWRTLLDGWRTYLRGLWTDDEFQFHLRRIYHQTKSVKEFFTSSLLAISELHLSTYNKNEDESKALQIPTPKTFVDQSLSCPDPAPLPFQATATTSSSPSSLPLSLLLAATRLTALYDPGEAQPQSLAPLALSFPAAYAEYARLLTSAKTSASVSGATATPGRVWGRDVAREAWEKLVTWGLVSPVGGGSGTADGRMFRVEVSFEEVVEMAGSGGSLGRWWRHG
ncbi:Origin recognition complex subunit [Aspergillus sclerotialis]|uniref:Origin recognition complex subunit 4 n=1 Tax=Aspergillus sclerotialis TaxID=2070753 RepID=A0A3A2ZSW2_9EURO|nr:Origin recognition complex subunit [Aspergillus sclerotialis]